MASETSSPSAAGSPTSATSNILTPTRKVRALLAQFDDSDSYTATPTRPQQVDKNPVAQSASRAEKDKLENPSDDSDDDDILAPRRPQSAKDINSDPAAPPQHSYEHRNPQPSSHVELNKEDGDFVDSEEDNIFAGRRTSNTNPKGTPSRRSPSPLFFPSPKEQKSKFLALVEKHRKQRLEKEAEEAAKQAARVESLKSQGEGQHRIRGSSPADDTNEESDFSEGAAGKKLSKHARPTRKASKKAIEEMNRETQRICRNMQLAHQARTKKKITKDSLLARFNFPVASSTLEREADLCPTSSSRAASDNEAGNARETPPTSPISEEIVNDQKEVAVERPNKGKGRALSVGPMGQEVQTHSVTALRVNASEEQSLKPFIKPLDKSILSKISLAAMTGSDDDGSDSDLEVVTSRGDMRKYAAFEHLPSRKAKEAPSHLALRSLANLIGEDLKHSMNAAEMEASLRRAARSQARQERQQRIEELKAKGVVVQTAEEREREQQEVEDLLERARQEAVEIQKREKALAKKDGSYTKDELDDEDESDDEDFAEDEDGDLDGDSEEEDDSDAERDDGDEEEEGIEDVEGNDDMQGNLLDDLAEEQDSAESSSSEADPDDENEHSGAAVKEGGLQTDSMPRKSRRNRVVSDDEDEDISSATLQSPQLPRPAKTPQSMSRSARKQIPGLQMSDDLPIGLTQAFAATMADSQSQSTVNVQEQDSLTMTADLPSPNIAVVPKLYRLESVDMITDSQPASQTQPLDVNLSFSGSEPVSQTPANHSRLNSVDFTPSQVHFEPTQDAGYELSPFLGNRFATDTPQQPAPHSTVDTVMLPNDVQDSPIMQRKARLVRGRISLDRSDEKSTEAKDPSAFDVMQRAAKQNSREAFDKTKSRAREVVDEAAEESEDEYAGLGGASDDEVNEEENEDDRRMIDEDTEVGVGDAARLAKLFADRERQQDEAAVSKLLKDITTGALRRKRANDDLDLSDEEDAVIRRREAKRREFAKMRRELLKDEAVGKIAEDKKKEAFLRSIEDRPDSDDDGDDLDLSETLVEGDSQVKDSQNAQQDEGIDAQERMNQPPITGSARALTITAGSKLNQAGRSSRPTHVLHNRRPGTLAEIRESVSFLVEEPDSQAGTIDLGLSDSEDEPEAYVDLDRHLYSAAADENAEEGDDLGDFIVDDDGHAKAEGTFKKPALPSGDSRAPFSERRTKERTNVVNRLSMLRQASSSSGSSGSTKMAFFSASSSISGAFNKVPSLLRRATTNSSLGSMTGRDENVSATGVVTNKTERGKASEEKEFVRKGSGSRRNAVNYRPTIREEKMSQRAGIAKKKAAKIKKSGFLGGLFGRDSWA
ncbi:uncharacterized protein Z519_11942 [Cladophialophora bantiana CBS 173.52]|uniref:DNA replication checkpoint mediator MRC1 domain-containing protein n=1 Tax=Cladophialophora bantiana (strain ATCC 10958 / CBS 173.52 / CDC B-1940 / NIH 8579) TaxID=1442370 RepID=A0A0D2EAY6_CLAB1|nr:uncharacterized protein Z519_11942 [Cladophialophora bantiana CBS 173.52]KIW87306.1 hypothetical protein Z519_11942 [Cladophialophora bantiana CBS 173.52]